ncbi:MAG: VOC family protein [bacterium]
MISPLHHVDCVRISVPELDRALIFYHDKLGYEVVWKDEHKIGLLMEDGKTEIVLQDDGETTTDLKVSSVEDTIDFWVKSGGNLLSGPIDIPIGKWAMIQDPWGNQFSILDSTKGIFVTDKDNNIIGMKKE